MAVVTIWISVILRPFQYGWIMAEHLGFGNHSNNTPPECSVVKIQLAIPAGSGIMVPIRKQAGVDVEAGRYNNN
jgi:hypothetical protein